MMGWIGDIFLLAGLYTIGSTDRRGFILSIIGESCWIIKAVPAGQWDLAVICVAFLGMAIRGYIKWGKHE